MGRNGTLVDDDEELILDDDGRRVRRPKRKRRSDDAAMDAIDDTIDVTCPWCFEVVSLYVDPTTDGQLVQDCDVCCHPWAITILRGPEGELDVLVDRS